LTERERRLSISFQHVQIRKSVTASGGQARAQLDLLRAAGLVENNYDTPVNQPDRIRITEAGRAALRASRAST